MPEPIDNNHPPSSLKRLAIALGSTAEDLADQVRRRFRSRFHRELPLHVIGYRSIGDRHSATVRGRVLAYQKPLDESTDTIWSNLVASYRRFETDEVPGILVEARIDDVTAQGTSDEEGYFAIDISTVDVDPLAGSVEVQLALPGYPESQSSGPVIVTLGNDAAGFGVISDIDDTVLVTNATSILRMMRLTLLQSSRTRLAFNGVAAFYQALFQGRNPFFYVSSSPWNLYEFLEDFLDLNRIPTGPLMLRDYGIDQTKLIAGPHRQHKLEQIEAIMSRYPALPFILIGDSGQMDPEIYLEVTRRYPERVVAAYIRDVSEDTRDREVTEIARAMDTLGVDMLLIPDTLAAANHAAARGWISDDDVEAVRQSVARDRQPDSLLDELVDQPVDDPT